MENRVGGLLSTHATCLQILKGALFEEWILLQGATGGGPPKGAGEAQQSLMQGAEPHLAALIYPLTEIVTRREFSLLASL